LYYAARWIIAVRAGEGTDERNGTTGGELIYATMTIKAASGGGPVNKAISSLCELPPRNTPDAGIEGIDDGYGTSGGSPEYATSCNYLLRWLELVGSRARDSVESAIASLDYAAERSEPVYSHERSYESLRTGGGNTVQSAKGDWRLRVPPARIKSIRNGRSIELAIVCLNQWRVAGYIGEIEGVKGCE
jgi:hypothetical protein